MSLYVDVPRTELRDLIRRAYATFATPDVVPVRAVGPIHVAELFHGPTLSFKDVALQFLGNLFERELAASGGAMNIVAATSGDTGSAAIHGVVGRKGIRIFVMHPRGRIGPLQERQMTSVLDPNVFNLAIEGTFDDCQGILKRLFADLSFKARYSLGAVNSINWARVLAQMVYYFFTAFRVMERTGARRVRFAVPTGNFGDILAGYLAERMGLPVGRLILATNENDILRRFFQTGEYRQGQVHATLSPAMDIQVASNFERYLFYRLGGNPALVRRFMEAFARDGVARLDDAASGGAPVDGLFAAGVGDARATLATIRDVHARWGYVLDPHTAVGVSVALANLATDEPTLCLATAHPAKFPDAIREATGQHLGRHPLMDGLAQLPTRCEVLPASPVRVADFIRQSIEGPRGAAP
jgi:threonine synthase